MSHRHSSALEQGRHFDGLQPHWLPQGSALYSIQDPKVSNYSFI